MSVLNRNHDGLSLHRTVDLRAN